MKIFIFSLPEWELRSIQLNRQRIEFLSGIPLLQCGWLEGCITTIPFFSRKNISDQVTARIFQQCKCIVIFVIMLSPSDDFSVATPDETNGQESEFFLT